jgi:hypothetical protein
MKDLVRRAKYFITFYFPLQTDYNSLQFASIYNQHKETLQEWSTQTASQKVIANYWLTHVLRHFALMFGAPALFVLLILLNFELPYLLVVFLIGLISFPILLLFHYWPSYSYDFLPNKVAAIVEYFYRKNECRKN